MDTRVLKYFLTVADTGNITKAAQQLHITQPTLSRQIMELENELGTQLLDRSSHHLQLTKAGTLFQQRAGTLLELLEQTKNALHQQTDELVGTINLGCVVSAVSSWLMQIVADFQSRYPQVRFNIFDGDGDTLRQRLDARQDDLACLIEPVEAAKYQYLTLPPREQWGLIMTSSDPLAKQSSISRAQLYQLPLIIPRRTIVRDEVSDVLKLDQQRLNIMISNNLPGNELELVRTGKYYAIAIKGILNEQEPSLRFVPFSPKKETGHVLVWRRNTTLSPALERFIQFITARINDQVHRSDKI